MEIDDIKGDLSYASVCQVTKIAFFGDSEILTQMRFLCVGIQPLKNCCYFLRAACVCEGLNGHMQFSK